MPSDKQRLALVLILSTVLLIIITVSSSYSQPAQPSPDSSSSSGATAAASPASAAPANASPGGSTVPASFVAPSANASTTKPKTEAPEKYRSSTDIRILPGCLNDEPCFNSNSPEKVLNDGILLSTFPPENMSHPEAHLNYSFNGDFGIFSHHVTSNDDPNDDRLLYLGFVMRNPSNKTVHVKVQAGASYLSQPDAPFKDMPEICPNDDGQLFAGPGDRITNEVMRNAKPNFIDNSFSIAPGQDKVFLTLPLPVRMLRPALNGRSTLIKMHTSGPVYIASLAKFVRQDVSEEPPSEEAWLNQLCSGALCTPRDEPPSPPSAPGRVKYGRVAGVSKGTVWNAKLADPRIETNKYADYLAVPEPGKSYTYPLSTVAGGTLGTRQVQSAPMLVRYPDTAYQAHGNYGTAYSLSIPLYNPSSESAHVQVLFQTALKTDEKSNQTSFYAMPPNKVFFRGTVFVDDGSEQHYWHLVQRQGSQGSTLAEFNLNSKRTRNLKLLFLYPPDATPPQELCIRTLSSDKAGEPAALN